MNDNNNIQDDDLNGMSPHLSKVNDNNPFKTGNNYFESFNAKLQNSIDGFEEIRTIAPILSSIPKYTPFEVPVNYFDELPTMVQQRIIDNKRSSTSIMEWLKLLIKPRFAVPVLATLFVAISGINYMDQHAELPKTVLAEEMTIEEQLYTIDEATIIETLTADANTENNSISDDDNNIEDYLLDNNIDETNLNNEFK